MGATNSSSTPGVVYTRGWIVDWMLDLAGYTANCEAPLATRLIIEPSCGTGSFLTRIVARLCRNSRLHHIPWHALHDSVRAYDIDRHSIDDARESIADVLDRHGCPYEIRDALLDSWLHVDDFLLSQALPQADYIIGNPPYIRASKIDKSLKPLYIDSCPSMTAGTDLYVGFFDKSLDLLRKGGKLCFICADRWLQNQYGARLRDRVSHCTNLSTLIRLHGIDAFADSVDAYPAIMLLTKEQIHSLPAGRRGKTLQFVNCNSNFTADSIPNLLEDLQAPAAVSRDNYDIDVLPQIANPASPLPLGSSVDIDFILQAQNLPSLEESGVQLGIGIATGCDGVFVVDDPTIAEPDRLLPLFYMRDYRRNNMDKQRWLVNPWNADGSLINLVDYPKMRNYLTSNAERLKKRHIARKNESAWYRTIDKVNYDLLDHDLLLFPDLACYPEPVLSHGRYPHHNCYWIRSDQWDLRVLGGLLSSDITKRYIDCMGVKMRGGTLRFQAQYLRLLHVPPPESISSNAAKNLAEAFVENDAKKATYYATLAYKEAME